MGLTNYPDGVSSFGIPLLGSGDIFTTGKVFFVHSGTGNNGNNGKSPTKALASLDNAIGRCTANKGDIIVLMPGHAENIAAGTEFQVDVAGIRIIGLGVGANRPTFTFTNTAGKLELDEPCLVKNIVLKASVSAVVVGINVDDNDITLEDVEMTWDETGDDFITMVDIDAFDRIKLINCKFIAEDAAGCAEAIRLDDCHNVSILGCHFYGDFTDAVIVGEGAVGVNLLIQGCTLYNSDTTAGMGIDLNVAFTGLLAHNNCGTLYATDPETTLDPGSCLCIENYVANAVDESGTIVPVTLST